MDRITEALEIVRRAKALGDFDTNVIGMAAEVIAEDELGMKKTSVGTKSIDGYYYRAGVFESVQVKAFSSSRVARYKGATFFRVLAAGGPDHLAVILFYSKLAEYEVLYRGKADLVGKLEANGMYRAVRLDSIKPKAEVERILRKIEA